MEDGNSGRTGREGAPSVFTAAGQAHLRGAPRRAWEECERLVGAFVTRVNQHGCGLSFSMDGGPPEGKVSFWLHANPEIRLSGRVSGGIVVMFGQDWATRHDMNGLVRTVVRDLTLARENPLYQCSGLTRGTAVAAPTGEGARSGTSGGFVREIRLSP